MASEGERLFYKEITESKMINKIKSGNSEGECCFYKAEVEGSTPSPITIICKNCLKAHKGVYGSGRFCSSKCAHSYSTKKDKKQKKEAICKTCKTNILVGKRSRKDVYCKKCLKERGNKFSRICKYCNQKYTTHSKNSKYCSNKCSRSCETFKSKMRNYAVKNKLGGHTSKNSIYYRDTNGNIIFLQSSYEVTVAKELDKNKIKWLRPEPFIWEDDVGINHRYYPDFFLPKYNIYLDPKNSYLIEEHKEKISRVQKQNNVKILILKENQLHWKDIKWLILSNNSRIASPTS